MTNVSAGDVKILRVMFSCLASVLAMALMSTLVAALKSREFDELPHFQDQQRAAIIAWRTRLQVLADRWGATLPANLQVAGRGEISPSPTGD